MKKKVVVSARLLTEIKSYLKNSVKCDINGLAGTLCARGFREEWIAVRAALEANRTVIPLKLLADKFTLLLTTQVQQSSSSSSSSSSSAAMSSILETVSKLLIRHSTGMRVSDVKNAIVGPSRFTINDWNEFYQSCSDM
jgi:hypothetical protein